MKEALLLVDLQNDYFPGGKMELVGSDEAVDNAALLLDSFRKKNREIIHVQHLSLGEGSSFFLPETEGVKIHKKVAPQHGEIVISKHFPNSFRETELLQIIQKSNIDHLIVCGAMSHMCIDATVRAAFDFGLQCTVAHDGCAARDLAFEGKVVGAAEVHGGYMAALSAVYAEVVSVSQLI
jgi:nicotinamidase-related amidase